MKKKTLTSAVLAGVAGVAGIANISSAVNLNPDGLGQVMVYPFYTVNGNNQTLMTVVNTTDQVKAVKVRFLESKDSRETLDFNLYLSPFDVWTGVVLDPEGDDSGPAAVATDDTTCTVPYLFGDATAQDGVIDRSAIGLPDLPFKNFSTLRFNEFVGVDNSAERSREGHIEVIEMGVVDETDDTRATGYESAAIHVGGVPSNCGALVDAWRSVGATNFWAQAPSGGADDATGPDLDVTMPTGGLFGSASIVNVGRGFLAGYNADAIAGFYTPAAIVGDDDQTLHNNPGSELPTLNQAQTGATADPVQSIVFDNGRIVTSQWGTTTSTTNAGRIDAVSAVYMHNAVYNEYAIDTLAAGATEWVMTFPTKRLYVLGALAPIDPFTDDFDGDTIADGAACEPIGLNFFDREETSPGSPTGGVNFSPFDPASPVVPVLCYEAQVVTYGQDLVTNSASSILGSPNARNIAVDAEGFENGWATIDFTSNLTTFSDPVVVGDDHTLVSSDGDIYVGLPVTGFQITVLQNGQIDSDGDGVGDVLSNYAGLFRHKASRQIIGS